MSVWFVTGAARGLGAEIVTAALAAGHQVVGAARHPEAVTARFPDAGDRLLSVALNVTDEAAAHAAAAAAVGAFGRIDVLVNNAGRGLLGAVEELPDDAVRAVYETNVFGTLTVLRAVLPTMRAQRSGHVVTISSIGGFTGSPGWGVYNSTKFALEGLSEALAREAAPLGIGVTIVEPGYFRTDFLDGSSLHVGAGTIDDYAGGPVGATRQRAADVNHAQPGDPAKAAAAIVAVVDSPEPPLRIQLGRDSFDAIAAKLAFVAKEQAAWRDVSLSTDHDDVG
ncbi:oxidoreductase [Jiangella rhizosphaerae]|uniref:SDR family NAD(P)-dependent oxidoreductase n=1 Tax=Jiangella rhizosphaerae TaxID=2293569 RepID=A0A418KSH8_9ACTN|nr:oxidoreductase [Jiangella rhizosphaerae]RIQ26069.1 SDR family NAD(P)-dependent oxidoreductase [Jiangella rhizosphaerae]